MKKFLVILGILMPASMGTDLFNVTGDVAFATDGVLAIGQGMYANK